MPDDADPARRQLGERRHEHPRVVDVDREPRHHGRTHPAGDETLDGAVVVGAEDDVRLDPDLAHRVLEQAVAPTLAEADQRHAVEIGDAATRAVRMRDEQVVVADDLDRLERPLGQRQHHEGEIELAALDEVEQVPVVVALGQPDLHGGPVARELLDERRQDARRHALEGADAERAALAGDERLHVGLRGGEPRLDRLDVTEQELAGRRHAHGLGPAPALEETRPHDPLERCDLLADRGLRVPELGRRLGERARPRHCIQCRQMPEIQPRPTIKAIYQPGK